MQIVDGSTIDPAMTRPAMAPRRSHRPSTCRRRPPERPREATGTFRALHGYNYRTWAVGAAVSNVGTWMQRIAQDQLVLTQLTRNERYCGGHRDGPSVRASGGALAVATGFARITSTGEAAARDANRMGALALGLGVLTVTGLVELWHVYVFASLLGCVTAFDAPARQTFVSDLVPEVELERRCAQFDVVQRGSTRGARRRRPGHRERGHRVGVPRERGFVRGRDRVARPAAAARALYVGAPFGARAASRTVFVTLAAPPI